MQKLKILEEVGQGRAGQSEQLISRSLHVFGVPVKFLRKPTLFMNRTKSRLGLQFIQSRECDSNRHRSSVSTACECKYNCLHLAIYNDSTIVRSYLCIDFYPHAMKLE